MASFTARTDKKSDKMKINIYVYAVENVAADKYVVPFSNAGIFPCSLYSASERKKKLNNFAPKSCRIFTQLFHAASEYTIFRRNKCNVMNEFIERPI